MQKKVVIAIAIFLMGVAGGFASRVFWPYIGDSQLEPGPVYLTETRQTYIQENIALVGAIERSARTVVAVRTQLQSGKALEGSGLIVTSDGLMVTLAELVPFGADFNFFVEGERVPYQILKRDLSENLALIKIAKSSLITAGFARQDRLQMGERVFLVGTVFEEDASAKLANEGMVRAFDEDSIQTSIIEEPFLAGSVLFNIEGEILGINTVDSAGRVNAIPVSKIRAFVGI